MATQQGNDVEFIPVTSQDIIGERKALYGAFVTSIPWSVGVTVALLVGIFLFWG